MVMIRPRPGTFSYTPDETDQMTNQISNAAAEGANGVVFGALTDANRIDVSTTRSLIERSRNLNLTTTFHRHSTQPTTGTPHSTAFSIWESIRF